jgi:hypothetical protein
MLEHLSLSFTTEEVTKLVLPKTLLVQIYAMSCLPASDADLPKRLQLHFTVFLVTLMLTNI